MALIRRTKLRGVYLAGVVAGMGNIGSLSGVVGLRLSAFFGVYVAAPDSLDKSQFRTLERYLIELGSAPPNPALSPTQAEGATLKTGAISQDGIQALVK